MLRFASPKFQLVTIILVYFAYVGSHARAQTTILAWVKWYYALQHILDMDPTLEVQRHVQTDSIEILELNGGQADILPPWQSKSFVHLTTMTSLILGRWKVGLCVDWQSLQVVNIDDVYHRAN